MAYKNSLITGITELLVLAILNQQDSYVYEITKNISNNSDGLLSISLNTIYIATYILEKLTTVEQIYDGFGHFSEVVNTYLTSVDTLYLIMQIRLTKWHNCTVAGCRCFPNTNFR